MSEAIRMDNSISKLVKRLDQLTKELEVIRNQFVPVNGKPIEWTPELEINNRTRVKLEAECSTLLEQINEIKKQKQRVDEHNERAFERIGIKKRDAPK